MMKRIYKKCLLLLITMSLVVIGDVQAAYNPYSQSGPYGTNWIVNIFLDNFYKDNCKRYCTGV